MPWAYLIKSISETEQQLFKERNFFIRERPFVSEEAGRVSS